MIIQQRVTGSRRHHSLCHAAHRRHSTVSERSYTDHKRSSHRQILCQFFQATMFHRRLPRNITGPIFLELHGFGYGFTRPLFHPASPQERLCNNVFPHAKRAGIDRLLKGYQISSAPCLTIRSRAEARAIRP